MMSLYEYDRGIPVEKLCGVDEAGRGPLAGPVYAGAVILPLDCEIEGINDSKKISEKKREKLYDEIVSKAIAYHVATASVEEIDEINILQATFLAMKRAVERLSVRPDMVLVDGNHNPDVGLYSQCVIKGDGISANIAAASILAKVSRDRYMVKLAEEYPLYFFEKHKGYGTKVHREQLLEHGPSPVHRKTFLKKILGNTQNTVSNEHGERGEKAACYYLEKKGYSILKRNFRTQFGEIDIIAETGEEIVFAEVKTRGDSKRHEPIEAVTQSKQGKIIKAALEYMQDIRNKQPRFDVVEVLITEDGKIKVRHTKHAFTTEGYDAFI